MLAAPLNKTTDEPRKGAKPSAVKRDGLVQNPRYKMTRQQLKTMYDSASIAWQEAQKAKKDAEQAMRAAEKAEKAAKEVYDILCGPEFAKLFDSLPE